MAWKHFLAAAACVAISSAAQAEDRGAAGWDSNRDGYMSRSEYRSTNRNTADFDRYDTDRDGRLNSNERRNLPRAQSSDSGMRGRMSDEMRGDSEAAGSGMDRSNSRGRDSTDRTSRMDEDPSMNTGSTAGMP